jgi:hypothetical protein
MKIYNMPEGGVRRFVVFRLVDGDAWFYGDWASYEKALEVAVKVDGQVIPADEVDGLCCLRA